MDYSAQRYIPAGACKVANKSGSAIAYAYSRNGKVCAIGFTGKARNPSFQYSFKNDARRAQYVAEFLRDADASAARRASTKAVRSEKLSQPTSLVVGDVLSCSWGYDQTNVDYFEVTKKIGARTIEIRKIACMSEDTGFMTGISAPTKGQYISEPMRKKVDENERVRIYSFASASKVDTVKVAGVEVFKAQNWSAYA